MPPVLSDDDLRFFAEHGYVVARGVIDRAQCERTAAEVWAFAELSPADPEGWAEHPKPAWGGGISRRRDCHSAAPPLFL